MLPDNPADNRKVVLETPALRVPLVAVATIAGGMNSMVPEINIIDENPPIFDLEWMDQCADKVNIFKRFKLLIILK